LQFFTHLTQDHLSTASLTHSIIKENIFKMLYHFLSNLLSPETTEILELMWNNSRVTAAQICNVWSHLSTR